jgi:predicted tellurium resistance membrane protein TerC
MFSGIDHPDTWVALLSLIAMEVVLGIDNIVFISVLTGVLPEGQRQRAARIGLALALVTRVALLFGVSSVLALTRPLLTVGGLALTGRQLVLFGGGLFLVAKATVEIHRKVEGEAPASHSKGRPPSQLAVIAQVALLDAVFSLDSVITAVGMVPPEQVWVMVCAVLVAVAAMLAFAEPVSAFVARHPTMKVLALAFLILIGVMLLAEGLGQHIAKGYLYAAMGFALLVELLNLRMRAKAEAAQAPATSTPS